jgi:hypothetical protein
MEWVELWVIGIVDTCLRAFILSFLGVSRGCRPENEKNDFTTTQELLSSDKTFF